MSISRTPRFNFETAVILTPFGLQDSFVGTSLNLCEGGILLRADRNVQKGLLLEFTTATFAGECRVMWSSPTKDGGSLFGIMFVSLGPRANEELTKLLYEVAESPKG